MDENEFHQNNITQNLQYLGYNYSLYAQKNDVTITNGQF